MDIISTETEKRYLSCNVSDFSRSNVRMTTQQLVYLIMATRRQNSNVQKAHKKETRGEEQTKAFEALKEAPSRKPVLVCFDLDVLTFVITDASSVGLGAMHLSTNSRPGQWSAPTYGIY